MIIFPNGHSAELFAASGSLAYTGDGYFWEWPLRWFGLLRPQDFTIITKTLTYLPKKGNLDPLRPWRVVSFVPGGVVNCVGLTNPGYRWWLGKPLARVKKAGYKVIVSIAPNTPGEASEMARDFNRVKDIVGLEINFCPNTHQDKAFNSLIGSVVKHSRHPVIVKLGITDPYLKVCREWDGKVTAFDLINSVPLASFDSPLAQYGYCGSLSGESIAAISRKVLGEVKAAGIRTPIISGGGIYDFEEMKKRRELGAEGISLGTVFLRHPTRPKHMVEEWQQ